MENSKTVYLRSKGGLKYGWGHLIRSLALARFLLKNNSPLKLLMGVEGDDSIDKFLNNQIIPYLFYDAEHYCMESEMSAVRDFKPDVIVVDDIKIPDDLLLNYRKECMKLCIFNDLGLEYEIGDIIITPQLLYQYPERKFNQRHLVGTDYFILSGEILAARDKKRVVKSRADSLLIIMGGCMYNELMGIIIKVIEGLFNNMNVKLVLGFDDNLEPRVYNSLEKMGTQIVKGSTSVGELFSEADITLSASGYLKYELAAVGTPSVLVSIVEHQDVLGRAFAELGGSALYLGNIYSLNVEDIIGSIYRLSLDEKKRRIMSQKGMSLLDGLALRKIGEALINND